MKFIILAIVLFIVVTFTMRTRRAPDSREPKGTRKRGASMYDADAGAVNVRSADNVRLISDDQLSAADGRRDKPVE